MRASMFPTYYKRDAISKWSLFIGNCATLILEPKIAERRVCVTIASGQGSKSILFVEKCMTEAPSPACVQ